MIHIIKLKLGIRKWTVQWHIANISWDIEPDRNPLSLHVTFLSIHHATFKKINMNSEIIKKEAFLPSSGRPVDPLNYNSCLKPWYDRLIIYLDHLKCA